MEKKHQASKDKIKKARRDGQVAKSQDVLRLGGLVVAFEFANLYYQHLVQAINHLFTLPSKVFELPFTEALERLFFYVIGLGMSVCLGAMLVIAIVKILITWGQTGFVFSAAPLKNGFSRMNPAKQLSQMFTLNKLWDIGSALVKLTVLIGLAFLIYQGIFADLLSLSRAQPHLLWPALNQVFLIFERSLLVVLIIIALIDIVMQNYFYKRRLKMTEQEVKQERKNRDGDPHIKSKRRSLAQQFLMDPAPPPMEAVKNADAVVVNPTHVAVALSYDPDKVPLPVVLYKAEEDGAKETIAFAQQHNIPVIRYLWLARTLYGECNVGQCIPRETIHAAASLFKVVKQLQTLEENAPPSAGGVYEMEEE